MVLAFFIFNYHTMKKINEQKIRHALKGFATAVCLLTAGNVMQAQIQLKNLNIISSDFTNTKRPQIAEIDNEESIVRIYDETFTLVKTINVPKVISRRDCIEERTHIPGKYTEKVINENQHPAANLQEVVQIAANAGLETHTRNGNVHTFIPLNIEIPGATNTVSYKKIIYTEDQSEFTILEIVRLPEYTDWKVIKEEDNGDYLVPLGINATIVGEHIQEIIFILSQNVFNSDDKYEFLVPVYEMEESPNINILEHIMLGDEVFAIRRRAFYTGKQTGINVMNEDGQILFTMPFTHLERLLKVGGKYYLANPITTQYGSFVEYNLYTIDLLTSSVKQTPATTESIKFYPRMARRSDNITIETGRAATGTRLEVIITTANGRVVECHSIPAGETRTQISASHLSAGMYNFTVYANGQRVDNGKIIIR